MQCARSSCRPNVQSLARLRQRMSPCDDSAVATGHSMRVAPVAIWRPRRAPLIVCALVILSYVSWVLGFRPVPAKSEALCDLHATGQDDGHSA
jgi:hypothetical protein